MPKGEVIAIANQKGGVGKTTTTFNLGVALAQQKKKVLLIDADYQGNLTTYMGIKNINNLPVTLSTLIYDSLNGKDITSENAVIHHHEGVDLIPANLNLATVEIDLSNTLSQKYVIKNCLSQFKQNYDYILIDCMSSLGMIMVNFLACTDKVIIPVQSEFLAANGMGSLLECILMVHKKLNPNLQVEGILLTMVDKRTKLSQEISNEVKETYGSSLKLFKTQIPRAIKTAESTRFGLSVLSYDKNCRVSESYINLAKEVISSERKEKTRNLQASRSR